MRIYNYGTKILRKVAKRINFEGYPHMDYHRTISNSINKKYIDYMTLPQMGYGKRQFTVKLSGGIKTFMNPHIVKKDSEIVNKETCQSIPGIEVKVPRYEEITIIYIDIDLQRQKEVFTGEDAFKIQHCYDHLDGVFIIDYMNDEELKDISGELNKISKNKEIPLTVGGGNSKYKPGGRKPYLSGSFGSLNTIITSTPSSRSSRNRYDENQDIGREEIQDSNLSGGEPDNTVSDFYFESEEYESGERDDRAGEEISELSNAEQELRNIINKHRKSMENVDSLFTENPFYKKSKPKSKTKIKKKKGGLPHFTQTSTSDTPEIKSPETNIDMENQSIEEVSNKLLKFLYKKR